MSDSVRQSPTERLSTPRRLRSDKTLRRTTIRLPDSLWDRLHQEADERGVSLAYLLVKAAETYLQDHAVSEGAA